ncbi:MAG: hypothetical protein F4Z00_08350 [Acidimicrobiaceae bacterium]|nr:hypothetical protein [Acidimicrobiaceae bacterium]MDE0492723.1 hypothetical protein [Acidimicrobiaceae bacterium]MXY11115.1 hypothetical protein [Acidimicrobiaceae bacterium]MXZ65546.1 hypothetical protein [Acidimicrobiaceae bacterium]MYE56798.1 hypothetical protein [Acidimicrobiaceae bacterium]
MGMAVPFPETLPAGYEWFDDEPVFDPDRHLQLEEPHQVVMLADLGYGNDEISTKATPVAASSPFRVLSDEGAAVMLEVARRLRPFARPAGNRIERMTRSGCYRSRWLRDLCTSQDVCDHLERIYGTAIAPHPMPVHLGHINYEPSRLEAAVDKWHHDTLPLDYVMPVTDPARVPGGRFEYFLGTRQEAAALAAEGRTPPPERVVAPEFGGPGYAIALHGDMVVHRAAPLDALAERISMVNGYVALDTAIDDQSRTADLIIVDDHETLWTEWAKTAAWRSKGRLSSVIDGLEFTSDRDAVIASLEAAVSDVQRAIDEMRAGARMTEHYGG